VGASLAKRNSAGWVILFGAVCSIVTCGVYLYTMVKAKAAEEDSWFSWAK